MSDKFVDLYEIICKLDQDYAGGRVEKYRVKQTKTNFLAQMIQPEHEGQGYSHRMGGTRVKVSDLLKVQRFGFSDGYGHIYRHIYCFKEQQEEALILLRANIDETVTRARDLTAKMFDVWNNRPFAVEERHKKAVTTFDTTG